MNLCGRGRFRPPSCATLAAGLAARRTINLGTRSGAASQDPRLIPWFLMAVWGTNCEARGETVLRAAADTPKHRDADPPSRTVLLPILAQADHRREQWARTGCGGSRYGGVARTHDGFSLSQRLAMV